MLEFIVVLACFGYAIGAFMGVGLIGIFLYKMDNPRYRAKLKKKIVNFIRVIFGIFVKD